MFYEGSKVIANWAIVSLFYLAKRVNASLRTLLTHTELKLPQHFLQAPFLTSDPLVPVLPLMKIASL
jgi:hypothetical protein